MAEGWVSEEPANALAKDLLASSYRKLADMQKLTNHPAAARADYVNAIKLGQEIVAAEPGNREFKTHLALALGDLADICYQIGTNDEARPLYRQSLELWQALVESDPEDLQTQLRLVQSQSHAARPDRDAAQFEQAAALLRPALTRLRKLDQEGRLEGRPSYKISLMKQLNEELAYSEAAPQVLRDMASVRTQPVARAARLLLLRSRTLAAQGHPDESALAADAICALEATEAEDLYRLAETLSSFIADVDAGRLRPLPAAELSALSKRCTDRAIADLTAAVDHGFKDLKRLASAPALASIRSDPRFQALKDRPKPRE
jgi:tetratricopeptide (TPR) repeat protein